MRYQCWIAGDSGISYQKGFGLVTLSGFMEIFKQTFIDCFSVRSLEVAYFWPVVLVWSPKYGKDNRGI